MAQRGQSAPRPPETSVRKISADLSREKRGKEKRDNVEKKKENRERGLVEN